MAKIPEKARFQALISTSQALWGLLILITLMANLASESENFAISFAKQNKTLGGPSEEYQQQRQDALLASSATIEEHANTEKSSQNIYSDSLIPTNAPNDKKSKKANASKFKISPPTVGWNWGQLHAFNAIDIANQCGTPIYAAKEGIVIKTSENDWNNGYGNNIIIEHQNKIETLYAHLQEIKISAGQFVKEKELIGLMGNTGNTHGPTGCHLHFEVHNAENTLAN